MATRISNIKNGASKTREKSRNKPVQERSRFTVEQILIASAQVFEEHGYAAGTTNRIARRAGVSIGTLYQYFSGKDAIAIALLERHIRESTRQLHEWAGHVLSVRHELPAAITEYVTNVLSMHSEQPGLQHILLEETPLPDTIHRMLLEAERETSKTMAGLLGIFPEVKRAKNEVTGYFVIQTVESLTHRFAAHPGERFVDEKDFIQELSTMLLAYLTCEK